MAKRRPDLEPKIRKWQEEYAKTTINGSDRILTCYKISQEAKQLLEPVGSYSSKELILALSRIFDTSPDKKSGDTTRARRLLRMADIKESLIERAAQHTNTGQKGASLSHLLLLTQITKVSDREKTLKWSIAEKAGYRKFTMKVRTLQAVEGRTRPNIIINELDSLTEALIPLMKHAATRNFVKVVNRIGLTRRQKSTKQLKQIGDSLTKIAMLIPKSQEAIEAAKRKID